MPSWAPGALGEAGELLQVDWNLKGSSFNEQRGPGGTPLCNLPSENAEGPWGGRPLPASQWLLGPPPENPVPCPQLHRAVTAPVVLGAREHQACRTEQVPTLRLGGLSLDF
jgi:hypothetical protein